MGNRLIGLFAFVLAVSGATFVYGAIRNDLDIMFRGAIGVAACCFSSVRWVLSAIRRCA